MALVKKSKLGPKSVVATPPPLPHRAGAAVPKPLAKTAAPSRHRETATERIAAATEELASGLAESAAATKELGRSMEQIATGAEEAVGASREQFSAIRTIVSTLTAARGEADASSRRTETVALLLTDNAAQISTSIRAIERGAQRQSESIALITELDRRAKDIGDITRVVSRISDQTNLLALNAAIEAARAGENGRGFAVVADEVRTLAETSDRNAREVQGLTEAIQADILAVGAALRSAADSALAEVKSAAGVSRTLDVTRADMARIAEGSREILTSALEAERAAAEAQRGAEQIASAANEQASGAAEAQTAVEQQAKALDQGQAAAQGLAEQAEALQSGKSSATAVTQIGATSEELSASIQELSAAAAQVMAAIEQINRASQQQSSATQETSAALVQIESTARVAHTASKSASDRVGGLVAALKAGRTAIESLITGVSTGLSDTRSSLLTIRRLEGVGRKIEKLVEAIALTAIQTSMLAVSGAVEAARAGEAGRGFAVVSNDIRTLSREASENIDKAKDTVRGILDQIALLKSDLDQIVAVAEVEVENSRGVFVGLQKIENDAEALGLASQSIQRGADEILRASTEIAKAARQIAAAAEQASAASREAATAATEQARGVEDLAAGIEEIASLADELGQRPS